MLLSCGIASWNLIFPLLTPCFHVIRTTINSALVHDKTAFPFFLTLMMFFGEFLGGISFECLSICINRTGCLSPKMHMIRAFTITKILPSQNKPSCLVFILILLIALIDGLSVTSEAFLSALENGNNINTVAKIFMLIFTCLFTKLLIRTPLHRHHLLSLLLIVIGFSIGIIPLFDSVSEVNYFIGYCCVGVVNFLTISLYFTAQKYLMEKKMMAPFEIILYQGIIGIVMTLSFMALMNISCSSQSSLCKFTSSIENVSATFKLFFNHWRSSLLMFASMVSSGFINVFYITISKIYSPGHEAVMQTFCFIFWHLTFGSEISSGKLCCLIIGDIILIVGSLFFFEFLILNWGGLNENTQKQIRVRCFQDKELFIRDMAEINEVND